MVNIQADAIFQANICALELKSSESIRHQRYSRVLPLRARQADFAKAQAGVDLMLVILGPQRLKTADR